MTWVLTFLHKVWNCWPERYGKFQSDIPSTSGAICEKPQGGPFGPPPSGARVNPRHAGVWLITRPAGGGGPKGPPEIFQTTGPISKFQTPFDSPVRELPVQGQTFDPEVTDDVTGRVKFRIFEFSGLVKSASKISMLCANKANESHG